MVTSYQYSKDLSKPVLLTIKYVEKGQSLDRVNVNIEIEEVSNPKTGISLFFIITSIILVWTYAIIDSRKKKQVNIKVFLIGLLFLPFTSVFAAEKLTLVLNGEKITSPKGMEVVYRKTEDSISVGDEYKIDTEHFYVVSSNNDETVLLAKYNLYVGTIYNVDLNQFKWTYESTISRTEEGYGMQSENAKGILMDDSYCTGTVPFSGKAYWVDDNSNLLSKYGTQEADHPWKNNNIYDPDYQDEMPELSLDHDGFGYIGEENYNNYSIAKYVEEYVAKLKELGAPSEIMGRLLLASELESLGCDFNNEKCLAAPAVVYNTSYWLGSASGDTSMWGIISNGAIDSGNFFSDGFLGVRPVVVVPTNELS